MCGLVFAISRQPVENFIHLAGEVQAHRGPDGEGVYFDKIGEHHLGFGHQRLALVDLSDNGLQPMHSASGRLTILFNGEIYNYRQLASQYGIANLKTGTDTEVALELIEKIGLEGACRAFNGMWSIVLWDRSVNRIFVARDRFGKKPLNYLFNGNGLYIASEVKAFFALDGFNPEPNPHVAARFLGQMIQNADEQSWVNGVRNLPASSIGEIDASQPELGVEKIRRYWAAELSPPFPDKSDAEYINDVRETVRDATIQRLHADVPVGIALSGGLDSSILAAIAAEQKIAGGAPATLFSVVHPGAKDDESSFVDIMAAHLNLDVARVTLDIAEDGPSAALDLIETCNHMNDGPLSSLSSALFYKLMEKAKELGITAVLTGQGADEAFCGYRKFPILEAKARMKSGHLMSATRFMGGFIANGTMLNQLKFSEGKRYFGAKNDSILGPASKAAFQAEAMSSVENGIAGRQLLDIERLSVPYLCHYEDRMSMAHSREVRSPFLDYRVVEQGLQLPTHLKMQKGWTKYALRQAFAKNMPDSITWRKDKKGFVNPESEWFRNELRGYVTEIMNDRDNPIYKYELVDRAAYMKLFNAYCQGSKRIWFRDVFAPFSLSIWLMNWQKRVNG